MEVIGQVTATPTSQDLKIADFNLELGENAIWLRTRQVQPQELWRFAYGLVYWKSTDGRELGTVKVYSHSESETSLLTVHRAPSSSSGALFFTPRAYNRLWINAHKDEVWTLEFSAEAGVYDANAGGGVAAAISNTLASDTGEGMALVPEGDGLILPAL